MMELKKKKIFILVDVLCVLVAAMPCMILTFMFQPYKRGVYCNDESIRYPYKTDTISHGMMATVTISCSIIIITSGEAYLVYTKRLYSNSGFNHYAAALYKVVGTFLFGGCVSQSLTDMAKFTIGRPRPNFMAVCAPTECNGYMLEINCTGNIRNVNESSYTYRHAWHSNGHASSDPQFSSSWSLLQFMWATHECLTTNTTGVTCLWASCRERSSPSLTCDTSLISSRSGLPSATSLRQPTTRRWSVNPACR
ncbi:phospholipid phosphatase 2 isoform X3 [Salminus brasiliensis]|uniref:phospholipid phosphatase 2 isoform X3 n=1 Tax=Salminus brasiliensis TaxID=930266 RepID=UPI003B8339DE